LVVLPFGTSRHFDPEKVLIGPASEGTGIVNVILPDGNWEVKFAQGLRNTGEPLMESCATMHQGSPGGVSVSGASM